jgi:hypothetical protein
MWLFKYKDKSEGPVGILNRNDRDNTHWEHVWIRQWKERESVPCNCLIEKAFLTRETANTIL